MQNLFSIMPDFLRDPDAFFHSIQRDENVRSKALSLGLVSLFYGLWFYGGLGKESFAGLIILC